MEALIYDDPARDTVRIILGGSGAYLHLGDPVDPSARIVEECAEFSEKPDFLVLSEYEYRALERAVLDRAGARLAERDLLLADVGDARDTRDRLLALVERVILEP